MLEELLCEKKEYFKRITYREAIRIVTEYLTNPPLIPKYKEFHRLMLTAAVKRDLSAKRYIQTVISSVLYSGPYQVEEMNHDQAVRVLYQDMYGLGPLEPLVDDPDIQEISVNGPDDIWYEKGGIKQRAEGCRFEDCERLRQVIDRCLPGREVNRLETFAQSLYDDSRIYVGIPPVAKVPYLNYRKFTVFTPTEEKYLETETLTPEALEVLKIMVKHRANITIIGPQNSGKTTLLSFLTGYYPPDFRIGVLESPEFEANIESQRPKGNVFALKTERKLGVSELDIFKHSLRFSADVLIIPEARGGEIKEVLKAQRRGNRGSMTTLHSISPENLIDDISLMITESGKPYQINLLQMMIAKSLDIVVTMHRFGDGKRKVIQIAEVDYDDREEKVLVNQLFAWKENRLRRTGNTLYPELAFSLQFHGADPEDLKKWGLIL
jgi:pilus assembly protein CpaF